MSKNWVYFVVHGSLHRRAYFLFFIFQSVAAQIKKESCWVQRRQNKAVYNSSSAEIFNKLQNNKKFTRVKDNQNGAIVLCEHLLSDKVF